MSGCPQSRAYTRQTQITADFGNRNEIGTIATEGETS